MSQIRYLFDEHIAHPLRAGLHRREPAIDVLCVGDEGAPAKGTPDPELLLAVEGVGRVLVTSNRRTMPKHFVAHLARGHHTWGIFAIAPRATWLQIIDELILLWATTTADEWRDQFQYIPMF